MLENKRSVTNKQLLLMIEELEKFPPLSHNRVLSAADAYWEQLVEKLNAVPHGAKRSIVRWKIVLSNWKLTLKTQATSNQNVENPEEVDELGQRLLRLMAEEELVKDIDIDLLPDVGIENHVEYELPQLRMFKRRTSLRAGLRQQPYLNPSNRADRVRGLKTIYNNNERVANPHKKIMQMQLDRLHSVSQQLESHIQDVQDRIQMIKDLWQHECIDE